MANMSNELKIGITVVVALLLAFVGFRIMKDIPLFRTSTSIYTTFDRVYGLSSGNSVNVKGYKIGTVKRMQLLPSDSTLVELSIEEDFYIPAGSVALLRSGGILGGKFIEIIKNDSTLIVSDGGHIPGHFEEGMMESFADEGAKLGEDISSTIEGVEELTTNLNETLTEENKDNVAGILSNLEATTQSLNQLLKNKQQDLDSMIGSAKSTLENLDDLSSENKEKLASMINNLEATSTELESLSKELNETSSSLNQVIKKINEGEGSLGLMINDPSLYNNLDSLSKNLNTLIKNIEENPGRYLKHMRLVEIF